MKILVLNCGSSSVKYKLIDSESKDVLAEGGVEKIGLEGSFLKYKRPDGSKGMLEVDMPEHHSAVTNILNLLTDEKEGVIKSFDEIDAVGHRVVHGMEKFNKSMLITPEVIEQVKECYCVAPLHNPANIIGIEAISSILPNVPQVGVFDTAFHQTMPAKAYMYALPYEAYSKYGVRRYGFHGTSHRYVSRRVCEFLNVPYEEQRIITCHVGNGGSITAIKGGVSIDTSMGLTPTEGLMMGTRCGDVDPGALVYLMQQEGLDADGISNLINKRSGVAGIMEGSSDMRNVEDGVNAGDERALLTLDMYEYRILKYIGAYAAALGGVDIIVFTGGVGENQLITRESICRQLEYLGVTFDAEANNCRGKEVVISGADSKVKVVVIPTDEELMIAQDTAAIVSAL
ncbi:MAG: acetate kinase [Muribaculaceae bacterium]|jgi:acetate kinase|nr:acetate kinase [Muribaculaceae bacterium]MBO7164569.1 acetate kinase [Muribaculaceae bacterium]MBQ1184253.1 acetate kinase [Muribaculaceae bacterium]MBQ2398766.1 acetate kinase [Muribaculaceae bacterium]MBQ5722832.1 acetate kinase [Muribaculaceae bacterium]